MSREKVMQFAEVEAIKVADGKRNKFINSIKGVAAMAYRNGTEDAWALARNMFCVTDDRDMPPEILNDPIRALAEHSFAEVSDTVTDYREKKLPELFNVGDEIYDEQFDDYGVIVGRDKNTANILWSDGDTTTVYESYFDEQVRRTGRKYGDIIDITASLRKAKESQLVQDTSGEYGSGGSGFTEPAQTSGGKAFGGIRFSHGA